MISTAVILAGGLGSRLRPLTQNIPKPLLPLGETTILESIINYLISYSIKEIYIACGYKHNVFKDFFKEKKFPGIKIKISVEKKRLGTIGPISLIKKDLKKPFLLINGDILTDLNINDFYNFTLQKKAMLGITTKKITVPFDFGIIKTKDNYVKTIQEKPRLKFDILTGVYILKPNIFKYIPNNKYMDVDELIKILISNNEKISQFTLKGYWADIGRIDSYAKANKKFKK